MQGPWFCLETSECIYLFHITRSPNLELNAHSLVSLEWDAQELVARLPKQARGLDTEFENQLLEEFPPVCSLEEIDSGNMPLILHPAIIVDQRGRIVGWLLPNILSKERQVRTMVACALCTDPIRDLYI